MNWKTLPDKEFLRALFTEGDSLGSDYIEDAKNRREIMIPFLCELLKDKRSYLETEDNSDWAPIHAVRILGILADEQAIEALITSSKYADEFGIDLIWEALPESYLRMGPSVIPYLKEYILKYKSMKEHSVLSEVDGLWNIWAVYPETKKEIEDFFLEIIKSLADDYELVTNLIIDFAQIKRNDLRPLFEEYYETGKVDLNTATREDLDYFFDVVHDPPGYRKDLEAYYSAEEIVKRYNEWIEYEKKEENKSIEEFMLENFRNIGRNEPCLCGSGKKFKKCHLRWAEDQIEKNKSKRKIKGDIFRERHFEVRLRRFLADKGKISLFSELKNKIIEVQVASLVKLESSGFLSFFQPIFDQIEFESKEELNGFMSDFMEYFNAVVSQLSERPQDGKYLH